MIFFVRPTVNCKWFCGATCNIFRLACFDRTTVCLKVGWIWKFCWKDKKIFIASSSLFWRNKKAPYSLDRWHPNNKWKSCFCQIKEVFRNPYTFSTGPYSHFDYSVSQNWHLLQCSRELGGTWIVYWASWGFQGNFFVKIF